MYEIQDLLRGAHLEQKILARGGLGWGTLAMFNAYIAAGQGASPWFAILGSFLFGPLVTFYLIFLCSAGSLVLFCCSFVLALACGL